MQMCLKVPVLPCWYFRNMNILTQFYAEIFWTNISKKVIETLELMAESENEKYIIKQRIYYGSLG